MDDITPRNPYRGERRDFTTPHRRPVSSAPSQPESQVPHHPHPEHQAQDTAQTPVFDQLQIPRQTPEGHYSHPTMDTVASAHHPSHQPVHHQTHPTHISHPRKHQFNIQTSPKVIAGVAIGLVLVIIAGFLMLKPSKPKATLPADLAKQASFSVYYPNPLPAGFSYDQTISTFQNNQAYYLLNKGTEHIVVREQPWSSSKLDTSSLTNPTDLQTTIGKAAIGTNTGQTAAVVLANSTLMTITSNGSVSVDEITSLINNLHSLNKP